MSIKSREFRFQPRRIGLLLSAVLLVVACSPTVPGEITSEVYLQVTPTSEVKAEEVLIPTGTATSTSTPYPTKTATATITRTLTPTMTPSTTPTVHVTPTITPTYDIRPLQPAAFGTARVCPELHSEVELDPEALQDDPLEEVLRFLNEGGDPRRLKSEGDLLDWLRVEIVDLTKDGVPEILIASYLLNVVGCEEGRYVKELHVVPETWTPFPTIQASIQDLNGNQIPELIVDSSTYGAHDSSIIIRIYEWNGNEFRSLISEDSHHPLVMAGGGDNGYAVMWNGFYSIKDIDRNGTKEVILSGGVGGGRFGSIPELGEEDIWMWAGDKFVLMDVVYDPPRYKLQAVWYADFFASHGFLERAMEWYSKAVFDPNVTAWNKARLNWSSLGIGEGTPVPTYPPPDHEQGRRVSAYARFRMMVTEVLLGNNEQAATTFKDLWASHPVGDPGNPYAQLASVFIEDFELSQSVGRGCQAVLEHAQKHRNDDLDVLRPLGYSTYGETFMTYGLEDICPYKP